jgi:hypothetical protein
MLKKPAPVVLTVMIACRMLQVLLHHVCEHKTIGASSPHHPNGLKKIQEVKYPEVKARPARLMASRALSLHLSFRR